MKERIKRTIEWWIRNENVTDFVIYPYGNNGKIAKDILNKDFGIQERFIVDNNLADGINIFDSNYLRELVPTEDFVILVTVHMTSEYYAETHKQISFVPTQRMIDIFSVSSFFNPWNFYEKAALKDSKLSIIEMISREIYERKLSGEVAEAGVYMGHTAQWINRLFPDRRLYLFDTFEGFRNEDLDTEDANNRFHLQIDFSDTTEEIVLNKLIYPQQCIIKKGWFPQTAEGIDELFCFARLDMDLYAPTLAGLNYFYDHIIEGYICVHDCRSRNFDGARAAVEEFCNKKGIGFVCMPDDLGTAVISINKLKLPTPKRCAEP